MQKTAWGFGSAFLVLGLLGFLPAALSGGLLLGIFAVDVMRNVVYILTGALGIAAGWSSRSRARLYFKIFGVVYAIFTVAGLLSGDTVLGLMATNVGDNLLHLVATLIALWLGFGAAEEPAAERSAA